MTSALKGIQMDQGMVCSLFVVEVDTSTTRVEAVFSQYHREPHRLDPCTFYSQKLTLADQNYDIGNRELLAIKLALEEWPHWLEGAQLSFTVITDQKKIDQTQIKHAGLYS